jgi:ADP-ribosylglycohydrolase
MNNHDIDSLDRFTGCLLAGAAGDALGAPVEFQSEAQIRTQHGASGVRNFVPAYGRVGAITDDTQMTLFTAEAMIRAFLRAKDRGLCSIEDVTGLAYQRWLITQGERSNMQEWIAENPGRLLSQRELHHRRAPGNTCLSALRKARSSSEMAVNGSKGCGGVMRMAPVGLAGWRFGWDARYVMELGSNLGHLTHGHPTGFLASGAFAVIIHALMRGCELSSAIHCALEELRQYPAHQETSDALNQAARLAARASAGDRLPQELGEGWIAEEALAIGVYCAMVAQNLEEGVILAANISGDSDSTASIAGNLLGCMAGKSAIPSRWMEELELRDVIEEIAIDLHDCMNWELSETDERGFTKETKLLLEKYPPN